MRTAILACIGFTLFTLSSIAQPSKVTTGIVAFQEGDYAKALEKFNSALGDPSLLDDDDLAKAYLYKGRTLMQLYNQAAQAHDLEKISHFEMAYPEALDCFVKSSEKNLKSRYTNDLNEQAEIAYSITLQMTLSYSNNENAEKSLAFASAATRAGAAFNMKDQYLPHGFMGKAYLSLGDTLAAKKCFNEEIKTYNAAPPARADYYHSYTYYYLAFIEAYGLGNLDAALAQTEAGLAFLQREHGRGIPSDDQASERLYKSTYQQLQDFQLQLYLNDPSKLSEAVQKFKVAVEAEPTNTAIRLVYASLLEQIDPDQGLAQYLSVLNQEPENGIALFNTGAIYVNKAVEFSRQSTLTEDYAEAKRLTEAMNLEMRKAYPLFKKAFELDPSQRGALQALKQITATLEMDEEYLYYMSLDQ